MSLLLLLTFNLFDMNDKTIKKNIQYARESLSITQREMAKKLGVSRQSYIRIESGNTALLHRKLQLIADECGISVDKLILGYEPGKNPVEAERELKETNERLAYTERERDMYKAKNNEDAKLIESLKDHLSTLQLMMNSFIDDK